MGRSGADPLERGLQPIFPPIAPADGATIREGAAMQAPDCAMRWVWRSFVLAAALLAALAALASVTVPTEIQLPGTQPGEGPAIATNCASCHGGTTNPAVEPQFAWDGSMMSHAARDPLFWATVAIAEQDFLPNADPNQRGGAGDLCLRCHMPAGWLGGRSTPTDGSTLAGADERGVECETCHQMVDPDRAVNIAGTTEAQTAPFEAFDPVTGEGYYGSAQFVMDAGGTRLGPYSDAVANHAVLPSSFHRRGEFCGTCHDVSNSAVGDLAHNNGAQSPLSPGSFSGVPGAPVDTKAAFNNPPYRYGVVERTFSEWKASALDTWSVASFNSLPADLRVPGGSLEVAYQLAMAPTATQNPNRPNYRDGTVRTYTCQTCHHAPATGKGCNKNNAPVRYDLPNHDMTGGGYWMPDVIGYQFDQGTLRFGTLTTAQRSAMTAGKVRAGAMLRSAASLVASQAGGELSVRVTNLTGHKLISGYPEGRRMWLNLDWRDLSGATIREDGAWGPIGRTVDDRNGVAHAVQSLLDPASTVVYEAKPGMDQAWANQLLALGYPAGLPLEYDRLTEEVDVTLGDLAAREPGSAEATFRFVLNNVIVKDNRIPPFGFARDEALSRNTLPVPASQFGAPGAGGVYQHWHDAGFEIPPGAASVTVRLLYQQTSWEYVQFLWLANDGANAFLGAEGRNLLDAWIHTGMSLPFEFAATTVELTATAGAPGEAVDMLASWNAATGQVVVSYAPACDATDHAIYIGDLASVASYSYAGAVCSIGAGGSATLDPGPGDVFFLIAGNDGSREGSFGFDSASIERPEDAALPLCPWPQELESVVCE